MTFLIIPPLFAAVNRVKYPGGRRKAAQIHRIELTLYGRFFTLELPPMRMAGDR
jgi:hypothetical protein